MSSFTDGASLDKNIRDLDALADQYLEQELTDEQRDQIYNDIFLELGFGYAATTIGFRPDLVSNTAEKLTEVMEEKPWKGTFKGALISEDYEIGDAGAYGNTARAMEKAGLTEKSTGPKYTLAMSAEDLRNFDLASQLDFAYTWEEFLGRITTDRADIIQKIAERDFDRVRKHSASRSESSETYRFTRLDSDRGEAIQFDTTAGETELKLLDNTPDQPPI